MDLAERQRRVERAMTRIVLLAAVADGVVEEPIRSESELAAVVVRARVGDREDVGGPRAGVGGGADAGRDAILVGRARRRAHAVHRVHPDARRVRKIEQTVGRVVRMERHAEQAPLGRRARNAAEA